jgi:hypothetical protein
MMSKPHCSRCDDTGCDAVAESAFEEWHEKEIGAPPANGIMRSAWEHIYMVACKAWRAALNHTKA